ncbi:hypothetical protein ACFWY5_11875 [Nonomuraea sp. NPDC059007]|uniref:hypothetical protein n=1 Tax=Nonomuraea sp. NPDC059007 TaxID=3346692 RepID=UPI003688F22B
MVEQLLYDHGDDDAFLLDYGYIDLSRIQWDVEIVPIGEFAEMPTGASDSGCVEEYATGPDHWVQARDRGIHLGVAQCWEAHETWKRWPILIDRRLLDAFGSGLQIVEGRPRVGVLRGAIAKGPL